MDHERKFYGYDELNTRWISFDETTGEVTTLREDAEGEAKITASILAGETLYSYDAEGYFYTVDTEPSSGPRWAAASTASPRA